MTREEYLAAIKGLTGIDVPTEDQQSVIESLVEVYDASQADGGRVSQLEAELAREREEHEALRGRFRENFWGGAKMKDGSVGREKKNAYEVTIEDLFN